jgi:hypothetical protein
VVALDAFSAVFWTDVLCLDIPRQPARWPLISELDGILWLRNRLFRKGLGEHVVNDGCQFIH